MLLFELSFTDQTEHLYNSTRLLYGLSDQCDTDLDVIICITFWFQSEQDKNKSSKIL